MQITITINTEDTSLKTNGDIGRAIGDLGFRFVTMKDGPEIRKNGKVMDIDGAVVGEWSVTA